MSYRITIDRSIVNVNPICPNVRYVDKVTFEDFWADTEQRDAATMRLSTLGEAARHINAETEALLPSTPFKVIRGMGNRITHDYGRVDFRIVWQVTQGSIAPIDAAPESKLRGA